MTVEISLGIFQIMIDRRPSFQPVPNGLRDYDQEVRTVRIAAVGCLIAGLPGAIALLAIEFGIPRVVPKVMRFVDRFREQPYLFH